MITHITTGAAGEIVVANWIVMRTDIMVTRTHIMTRRNMLLYAGVCATK